MRKTQLFDKVYGTILGGAIGDAYGIRVEMMHYKDIEAQYGLIDHFNPLPRRQPSGQSPLELWHPFGKQLQNVGGYHPLGRWSPETGAYTDDMRYRLMAIHTMLQKGGPITGAEFGAAWLNYRLAVEGAVDTAPTLRWQGPERAYARIMTDLGRLRERITETRPCFSGWDAPIGLIHAGQPEAAAQNGYAMAVAVATALTPKATIADVVDNVLRYSDILGTHAAEFRGRLEKLMDIAAGCQSVLDLRQPFYHEFLVGFPPWDSVWTLEMVPCALAVCSIAKTPHDAIVGGTMIGRDADTIVGIIGELMGALYGVSAFPPEWASKVESCNPDPDMTQMAEDLCQLITTRARVLQAQTEALLTMVEG